MKLPNESANIYLSSVNLHENFLLIELQEILLLKERNRSHENQLKVVARELTRKTMSKCFFIELMTINKW